jgi:hypothetical protein
MVGYINALGKTLVIYILFEFQRWWLLFYYTPITLRNFYCLSQLWFRRRFQYNHVLYTIFVTIFIHNDCKYILFDGNFLEYKKILHRPINVMILFLFYTICNNIIHFQFINFIVILTVYWDPNWQDRVTHTFLQSNYNTITKNVWFYLIRPCCSRDTHLPFTGAFYRTLRWTFTSDNFGRIPG